ncbi:MAG TPA: hypothetical protein VJ984_02400 [Xanthomonadales bacterium]|nr:hypothetical protein [Xanthomonadales bacterium]
MRNRNTRKRWSGLILVAFCIFGDLKAQETVVFNEPEPAHWAFASVIGTGWYQLEGGRSAFILTATPRQYIRESGLSESGERQLGLFINYDTSVGFFGIDDIPGFLDSDNFSTLSFTPGIGIEIPVTRDWYLRGYANFGWGTSFGDGTNGWIYYSGIRSRYRFGAIDKNWALLNSIFFAGINPDGDSGQSISGMYAGLEFSHAIPGPRPDSGDYMLHWNTGYTFIDDSVRIAVQSQDFQSIGNTAEIGVAISRPQAPFRLWFMQFERLGLTYAFDSRGNYESLTFNFTSWFDK